MRGNHDERGAFRRGAVPERRALSRGGKALLLSVLVAAVLPEGPACREPQVANITLKQLPPPPKWKAEDHAYVSRVLTGDTFVVDMGERGRQKMTLQGLRAPGRFAGDSFHGASLFLAELIEGQKVIIETPTAGAVPDAENRVPCWVFIAGTNVNLAVIEGGWARLEPGAPRFRRELAQAEQNARDARRGIWASDSSEEDK